MRFQKTNTIEVPTFHIKLGGGFVLLFALVYFFDDSGLLAAIFPVVLVHELGHILFMIFFGAYPRQLNATFSGFAIDYCGVISEKQEMMTALAGPAIGLAFSLLCAELGRLWSSDYLLMCSGLGFVINFFNLLPALPLDGGRVWGFALRELLGEDKASIVMRAAGLLIAILLLASGLFFIAMGFGFALFLAGIWLFILQQNKSCK